jgi:hypothetical protein
MVAKTLAALGTQCSSNPFSITAMRGDDSRNVRLTFPGVAFSDSQGKAILATPLSLPDDIKAFLGAKGYRVLALFPS